jgi:hypothetical protein
VPSADHEIDELSVVLQEQLRTASVDIHDVETTRAVPCRAPDERNPATVRRGSGRAVEAATRGEVLETRAVGVNDVDLSATEIAIAEKEDPAAVGEPCRMMEVRNNQASIIATIRAPHVEAEAGTGRIEGDA